MHSEHQNVAKRWVFLWKFAINGKFFIKFSLTSGISDIKIGLKSGNLSCSENWRKSFDMLLMSLHRVVFAFGSVLDSCQCDSVSDSL